MTIKEFTLQDMEDNAEDFSPEQVKAIKKYLNNPKNASEVNKSYTDYEEVDNIYTSVNY